jgi:hypothetical protein
VDVFNAQLEHAEQHRSHESKSGKCHQHVDRTAKNHGRLPFLSWIEPSNADWGSEVPRIRSEKTDCSGNWKLMALLCSRHEAGRKKQDYLCKGNFIATKIGVF